MKPFFRINSAVIVQPDDPVMASAWCQIAGNSWAISISELVGSRFFHAQVVETDAGFEMYESIEGERSHRVLDARDRPSALRIARDHFVAKIEAFTGTDLEAVL